ncbi:calcium-binding protein [Streptomyces sp. NPDC051940]|uniref:calcium-binding protein n=1 Tax=Streptomyces sp. NPDC051940 TaxID=3155675 RepID=UPI00342ED2F0
MRKFAMGAALLGALGLAVTGLSSAQADEGQGLEKHRNVSSLDEVRGFPGKSDGKASTFGWTQGNTTFSSVVVNGNKNIAVGTTNAKTFSIVITVSDPDGIQEADAYIWRGTDPDNDVEQAFWNPDDFASCTPAGGTTVTCTQTITILPHDDVNAYLWNTLAGTWNVYAGILDGNGEVVENYFYKTTKVQRYAKATVNATPEPVSKGRTLTVYGKLTRASWDSFRYLGYSGQWVSLDYRRSGDAYVKIKGVKTNSSGDLKGYATAYADGYWRYYYKGNIPTSAATAAGDYVDVR